MKASLITVIAATIIAVTGPVFAATPMAPTNVCVGTCSTTSTSTVKVKWHPGHYAQIGRDSYYTSQSARFQVYDSVAKETSVVGFRIPVRLSQLYPVKGDSSTAISLITAEINKLKSLSVPKRLIVQVISLEYLGSCSSSAIFPKWFVDAGHVFDDEAGCQVKFYDSAAVSAYTDLLKTIVRAFDNEPYFEGLNVNYEYASKYTGSAYHNGLIKTFQDVKSVASRTSIFVTASWPAAQSYSDEIANAMAAAGVGAALLDTIPDNWGMGDGIWGLLSVIGQSNAKGDYRGVIPISAGIENSEMGYNSVGRTGGYTPAEFMDYINNTMHASQVVWDMNEETGTAAQRWSTGILPYIRSNPMPRYTACPTAYVSRGGCDST